MSNFRLGALLLGSMALCACAQQQFLSDQPDYPCGRQVRDHKACVNAFSNSLRMRDVQLGQTIAQVRETVGKEPEAREAIAPDVEAWLFHTDYAKRLWTRIVFKQGKVAENPAQVKEANRFVHDPQGVETESTTLRRLRELKLLLDRGAITTDEYEEKRRTILRDL